jgi:signal transduction histidine kinase
LGKSAVVSRSTQIDLAELVRSTTEALSVVAHEQDIALRVRCAATSVVIFADAEDLTHVVSRLLACAISSSTRNTTVDCELSLSADWIQLVIRTAGSDAIFARIPSIPESWEELGLATVRASVRRQGGIVRVESRERQLIFTLSLPGDRARRT